jgi:hypothetical protein
MRRFLAALLLAGCAATAPAPRVIVTPPANPELSQELRAMLAEDQEVRQRWLKDQKNEAIRDEVRALGAKHTARLEEIVKTHGWPGKTLLGEGYASAGWTIAQHGGHEFLERMLPLMYQAVIDRELDEGLYATSLDRVLIRRGMKQMYGTQFDVDVATGKCQPLPIEDEAHVEERRKRAGMTPLTDYTKELCEMYLQK